MPQSTPSPDVPPDVPVVSSQDKPAPKSSGARFPNPNVQNNPHVYMAVYSSIPVYEMMVRGIGVMRRRSDSFMNATQILKVAGVAKSKRTRILEREIVQGHHEKIQGGYGRYQGTWVPFARAQELASQFNVVSLLAPIFDYLPAPTPDITVPARVTSGTTGFNGTANSNLTTSSKPPSKQSAAAKRHRISNASLPASDSADPGPSKRSRLNTPSYHSNASQSLPTSHQAEHSRTGPTSELKTPVHTQPQSHSRTQTPAALHTPPPVITPTQPVHLQRSNLAFRPTLESAQNAERNIHALMSVFASPVESHNHHAAPSQHASSTLSDVKKILERPDLNVDTPIDEHCHTALHWAAALARIDLVRLFVDSGADVNCGNNVGETALMRAALVTNNFDRRCFDRLLDSLHPSLWSLDLQDRTVLHHICLTANIKGRAETSRYYMQCILEWIAHNHNGKFDGPFIDAADANGDTALNISARVGNKHLVRMLLNAGANRRLANKLGLRPTDFGVDGASGNEPSTGTTGEDIQGSLGETTPMTSSQARKSHDVIVSMTMLINSLSDDFHGEIQGKAADLERVRDQLKAVTRELTEQRRQIDELKRVLDGRGLLELCLKKLKVAVAEEDDFDWTGRSEIDGRPAAAGKAFENYGPGSTLVGLSSAQIQLQLEPDPPIPTVNNVTSLIYLRRMRAWYKRALGLLSERISKMKNSNMEQEAKYLKVIGSFIGHTSRIEADHQSAQKQQRSNGPNPAGQQEPDGTTTQNGHSSRNHTQPNGSRLENEKTDHSLGQDELNQTDGAVIDAKLLNQLMAAIEADGPELDLDRVAGFMRKVHPSVL